jgi:hypothetical protein
MMVAWDYQTALWAAQESYIVQIYEDPEMQRLVFSSGTIYSHVYEKAAKEKDSDRRAHISGLSLAKDRHYYLRVETKTVFGFTCSNSEAVVIKNYSSSDVSKKPSLQPKQMELEASYPNPFNSKATISYSLEKTDHVALEIYDILGVKVCDLSQGVQNPGYYKVLWNALDDNGQRVSSGLYIIRLKRGSHELSGKMTLLK